MPGHRISFMLKKWDEIGSKTQRQLEKYCIVVLKSNLVILTMGFTIGG